MTDSFFQRIKEGITRKKGVSFWFLAASLVCAAAMLILYLRTGTNTFTPALSGKVLWILGGYVVLAAVLAVFEIKNGKYLLYLLSFWVWLEFLVYNASYISNVLVGIDGNAFGAGFLLTVLSGLLCWVCALTSAILQKNEGCESCRTACDLPEED